MRRFLKTVFSFFILFLGLYLVFDYSASSWVRSHSNFRKPTHPKYIVIGHSHPASAFNDSLIAGFWNVAEPGEPYFYNYQKAKLILAQNPEIETVFIEFTNNQLKAMMDDWTWDESHLSYFLMRYAAFLDYDDQWHLLRHNPSGFFSTYALSTQNKLLRIYAGDYMTTKELGGFAYLPKRLFDSVPASPAASNAGIGQNQSLSENNLVYLDRMVNLCKKYGKKVILIRSPLHREYNRSGTEERLQQLLKTRYQTLEFLDFANLPLSDEEFGDYEHVNAKGAWRFSVWFDRLLNAGLLRQNNKNAFLSAFGFSH